MHRLRVIHNFLWYLLYERPLQQASSEEQDPCKPGGGSRDTDGQTQTSENVTAGSVDPKTSDSALEAAPSGEGEEELRNKPKPAHAPLDLTGEREERSTDAAAEKHFCPLRS